MEQLIPKHALIDPKNAESLGKLPEILEKAIDGWASDRRESKWPGKLVHKGHRPKPEIASAFLTHATLELSAFRFQHFFDASRTASAINLNASPSNALDSTHRQLPQPEVEYPIMSLNPSASDSLFGADPHLHGFDEAKRDLLMADSVNDRANAAFTLGLLGNAAGVAYLIAALYDNEPKVRNAAAESLGQIGDSTALGPLNDLQHREGSSEVVSNAISLVSGRQNNFVPADESADAAELESTRKDGATDRAQLNTETWVEDNFLMAAVAEIDAIFKAQAVPAEPSKDVRDESSVTNAHENAVESGGEPRQLNTATNICTEINAGFELLRQAEARQSELIAEAEARLLELQEARQKSEVIVRQRAEQERSLLEEIEALRVSEHQLGQRIHEAEERRREQLEAVNRTVAQIHAYAEEESLRLADLEERRRQAEDESRKRSEQEQQLKLSMDQLVQTTAEQKDRIATAEAHIAETLRTLKADEERHVAEAQAAMKLQKQMRKQAEAKAKQRSKQAQRLSEEIAALENDASKQDKKIAECEAEIARAQEASRAQSEAEVRLREEIERLRQAEAETRLAVEANEIVVADLGHQVQAEKSRLAELAATKKQAEAEAKQRSAREAEMKRRLKRLEQAEQQQSKRLQQAEASLQAKEETINQLAAEVQRLSEEDAARDSRIASLRETLQQIEAESQEHAREEERRLSEVADLRSKTESELDQRKEFEQQLTEQLEALRASGQNQLNAILELEVNVEQARSEAQQQTAREADLKQQLLSLASDEQELRERLQDTESALALQQLTLREVETEFQERAKQEEEQLAVLAATREQGLLEADGRARAEKQLSAELASLRATEKNQLKVIKRLEEQVQRTRTESEQLSSREAELNTEIQTLQARLAAQHESQAAAESRRAELDEAARLQVGHEAELHGKLEALRQALDQKARLQAEQEAEQRKLDALRQELDEQVRLQAEREAEHRRLEALRQELDEQARLQAEQEAEKLGQLEALRQKLTEQARLQVQDEAVRLEQLEALHQELSVESQKRTHAEQQLHLAIEALRVDETAQLARLEDLRQHAAALDEAKQLRDLEESSLSVEIAEHEASIVTAKAADDTAQPILESKVSEAQEPEQLVYLEQAYVEEVVPLMSAGETVAAEDSLVVELSNEEEAGEVEPMIISSDSFSFELSSHASNHEEEIVIGNADFEMSAAYVDEVDVSALEPVKVDVDDQAKSLSLVTDETGLTQVHQDSPLAQAAARLQSANPAERCEALMNLSQLGAEESFDLIAKQFDDPSVQVRNAAARALCELSPDRAALLTRALREAQPERRRRIGAAFAGSGLASQAINCLAGEGRDVTYDAFTILFLMAKAGEVQPLVDTIENHENITVRLAVIKLLAFSNQSGVVPAFRRLAVRASLPAEVRSAVMEAIHDIGTPSRQSRISAA